MKYFCGMTKNSVTSMITKMGYASCHSKSLYRNFYTTISDNIFNSSSLPADIKRICQLVTFTLPAKITSTYISKYDHSVKFIIQLQDGFHIESVLLPENNRMTLCLSSQVGCQQQCVFCATGRMGLKRSLTTAEIVSQLLLVKKWLTDHHQWRHDSRINGKNNNISNLVFMGMGEPLDNWQAVDEAITIFCDQYGLSIAPKKVTVSTAGHLDGLNKLYIKQPKICYALSLHAPDKNLRAKLMPITKKYHLDKVLEFFVSYSKNTKKQTLIQYMLIAGVNNSSEQAQALVKLIAHMKVKINLIPFNPISGSQFCSPSSNEVKIFRDILHQAGITTMVRYSKGQDIAAACGQLLK